MAKENLKVKVKILLTSLNNHLICQRFNLRKKNIIKIKMFSLSKFIKNLLFFGSSLAICGPLLSIVSDVYKCYKKYCR